MYPATPGIIVSNLSVVLRPKEKDLGSCTRSWLSGNLGKTALKLIEISRMYFDTH